MFVHKGGFLGGGLLRRLFRQQRGSLSECDPARLAVPEMPCSLSVTAFRPLRNSRLRLFLPQAAAPRDSHPPQAVPLPPGPPENIRFSGWFTRWGRLIGAFLSATESYFFKLVIRNE